MSKYEQGDMLLHKRSKKYYVVLETHTEDFLFGMPSYLLISIPSMNKVFSAVSDTEGDFFEKVA